MPSRTSRRKPSRPSPRKAARSSSEADTAALARELAPRLGPRDRVLLEGPLGAGKSTFARALLEALGAERPAEGSPSFAIAHEYGTSREGRRGEAVHVDFYRIRSEAEIAEAGIGAYYWEREAVVISEWLSNWPEFERAVVRGPVPAWSVRLEFSAGGAARDVTIRRLRRTG